MAIKIKTSNYPEEWYCVYHKCCNCGTEFMCSTPNYCPGCGQQVEEVIRCDYEEMSGTDYVQKEV